MKRNLILLCILFISTVATAQEVYRSSGNYKAPKTQNKKGFDASRLVFGGGIGLMLGNYTNINLQPKVGYSIVPGKLATGVGLGFGYESWNDAYKANSFKRTFVAPSLWAWYTPIQNVFVNAEYQYYFVWQTNYWYNNGWQPYKTKGTLPALWLGAGYRQPLGNNASFYIGAYINALNQQGSVLDNLTIRSGIMLGI